jgi:hypothetical protein
MQLGRYQRPYRQCARVEKDGREPGVAVAGRCVRHGSEDSHFGRFAQTCAALGLNMESSTSGREDVFHRNGA